MALAEATGWVGRVPGVVIVGQGDHDGVPTIDVWVTDTPAVLPTQLHGVPVRTFPVGGPIEA